MSVYAQRLRITFAKGGLLRHSSHLDLARAWERSFRRAGVPLAYSHGFNPRPRLHLAAALPLGHTGEAELLDVWLESSVLLEDFTRAVSQVVPIGLSIGIVRQVSLNEPALQTRVVAAEYCVTVEWGEFEEQVKARVQQLLAADELPCERRGRCYDLRPLIERLCLERVDEGEVALGMLLAARGGATARPEAVLESLGMDDALARYHRRRLIWAA
jgi:radical SAM-linked protein